MTRLTRLLLAWLLLLAGLTGLPVAAQEGVNRAAIVVRYPDGAVWKSCVSFSEPSITGEELLRRSGLTIVADYSSGLGGAVCSINGSGCAYPAQDCFCRCQGVDCQYWAYFHWAGGGWQYSQVGASVYQVGNGALEGWSWGPGNFSSGTEPPSISFAEICVSPTASPTLTATASPTGTPTRIPSPTPTSAPVPVSLAPQTVFEISASSLAAGACAVLKWVTWDADRVTLNGEIVMAQDRQEVCPAVTRRYVLVATNAAGQTTRELTINVATPVAGPSPVPQEQAMQSEPGEQVTPVLPQPMPGPTATPQALPVTAVQSTEVVAARAPGALWPAVQAQELPLAASAPAPAVVALPSPRPTAIPTATPEPRRPVGADGQPTPTRILLARVPPAGQGASERALGPVLEATPGHGSGMNYVPPDRGFSKTLLPGYAAYLFTAALLVGVGAAVVRRRQA
jgi:hypothetical protein